MRSITIFSFFIGTFFSLSQNYVDTLYEIETVTDIHYGTATNFAGVAIDLHMDISYPTNDIAPACGRPLALIIHGGAWAAGSKEDNSIKSMRADFAKRGYVAAAINYRLGYFQTEVAKNCNIPNWNCMNLADSSEWVRAWYRGIQDAKGALRFLLEQSEDYEIDASNVFVFGESAGAFVSLGVVFMDQYNEKPASCNSLPDVLPPHQDYYGPCIENSTFDIPIEDMDLSRPDLGPVEGTMNPSNKDYVIRGAGSLYGGVMTDLFSEYGYFNPPHLYVFHQPNDLIVPINYDPLLKGFNSCASATGCFSIQDRPNIYGGEGIINLIDTLSISQNAKPTIIYETTNNTVDCITQVFDPSTGGHQLDSYWTRTSNMAAHFADNIGVNSCDELSTNSETDFYLKVFPNPAKNSIKIAQNYGESSLMITDIQGKQIISKSKITTDQSIDISELKQGVYFVNITSAPYSKQVKLIVID